VEPKICRSPKGSGPRCARTRLPRFLERVRGDHRTRHHHRGLLPATSPPQPAGVASQSELANGASTDDRIPFGLGETSRTKLPAKTALAPSHRRPNGRHCNLPMLMGAYAVPLAVQSKNHRYATTQPPEPGFYSLLFGPEKKSSGPWRSLKLAVLSWGVQLLLEVLLVLCPGLRGVLRCGDWGRGYWCWSMPEPSSP